MKTIESMALDGKSSYEISREFGVPRTTIAYRLKKLGIKSGHVRFGDIEKHRHLCLRCGDDDKKNFYGHKKRICRSCFNEDTKSRIRLNKINASAMFGGKCSVCGYDRCQNALEFHHIDPSDKDENFNTVMHRSWESVKKALYNCVMLCANCHREAHSRI